jgi:hypothetical protein
LPDHIHEFRNADTWVISILFSGLHLLLVACLVGTVGSTSAGDCAAGYCPYISSSSPLMVGGSSKLNFTGGDSF